MPDTWENANGLNRLDPSDAKLDSDGDGLTNLQEYIAGTDPRSKTSKLQLALVSPPSGTNIPTRLAFTAAPNRSYTVQFRTGLDASVWQKLQDIDPVTTARSVEVLDPKAPSKQERYYRLVTPATN